MFLNAGYEKLKHWEKSLRKISVVFTIDVKGTNRMLFVKYKLTQEHIY